MEATEQTSAGHWKCSSTLSAERYSCAFRRDPVCKGRETERYLGVWFLGLEDRNLKTIKAQCHTKSVMQSFLDFPMEFLHKN